MHEPQSRCFSEHGPTLPTDHVLTDWQEPFTTSSKQRLCRVIATVNQAWGQNCLGEVSALQGTQAQSQGDSHFPTPSSAWR